MEGNTIYEGDNLEILSRFPDKSVDLIYADPPFFSNRHYEVIWDDGAEIRAFQDRWKGGIEHYISWMEPRLRECQRVLKDTGSMYLHCDSSADAYLRILMDKIFYEKHFVNEIVWHYGGPSAVKKGFPRKHDIILFYGKSSDFRFNQQFDNIEKSYVMRRIRQDPDGRKWVDQNLGKLTKETIGMMQKEGRIFETATGNLRRKQYIDEMRGEQLTDVWDIDIINSQSKERLGYPTQKPVALLERIVNASSNKGDIVLDPFCGCGTTLVAAQKLGRKWVGIDVSPTACKLMKKRLREVLKVDAKLIRGEVDLKYVKSLAPFEFQNWVIVDKFLGRVSDRKSGDMGIDGFTAQVMGGYPVQVKQSESVGRNVVDNFETAMRRVKKKRGYIVAYSFVKGAYEEAARVKNQEGLEVILRTVEEILAGKVEDDVQYRLPVEPR